MSEYNVECPKKYGKVTFLEHENDNYCPISGKRLCVQCDVISFEETKDGQVKRKRGSKKEGSKEEEPKDITWL